MSEAEEQPVPAGIDIEPVTAWLANAVSAAGGSVAPPLHFDQIAGGRSNLTFQVTDVAGTSWALRRPPTGNVLASAHDMGREHRVMSALAPTLVPVPTMVGLCDDESVTGAPFYVMDWVEGTVVRNQRVAATFDEATIKAMCRSVVETMAKIHQVDIDEVGLGDFAKREGYVARQLKRWKGQVDATSMPTVPAIERAFDELSASIPDQGVARLVHGDYRLDNTIVGADGAVLAVLDWELTTLGDPLADLGAMLTYWSRPGDSYVALTDPPTLADGFIERDEVVSIYEDAIGRSVGNVGYYHAFATWRLACILDGVVDRYRAGAMGKDDDFDADGWASQVTTLAESALESLHAS
ncbi:MAG: phosphotransferase family protein [Acidimicrobiales bacterium]|nr:MAG: phosphotransferase family protein [Acidimicrobiales bacterium]